MFKIKLSPKIFQLAVNGLGCLEQTSSNATCLLSNKLVRCKWINDDVWNSKEDIEWKCLWKDTFPSYSKGINVELFKLKQAKAKNI